ncbi:cold-shock protein [Shewanella algae]|uniref:cold-shock protein n=1 Tax=Shewanella algae TaxID=38313 RepID=UPI0031F552AF
MKGKVVSYVSSKKFGFINGDDGESYFLHVSALVNRSDEAKLVKNVLVEFDPTPTPKGLSAKQIRIPEVYIRERLLNFFTSKGSNPKHGDAALRLPISTRFFKDPAKGRQYIEELAKQCGCNAVLGLEFEKKTFSEGNYRFTGHAFKGELALVTEKQPCDTKEKALAAERQLQQRIQAAEQAFGPIQEAELKARQSQLSGCLGSAVAVLAVVAILPAAIIAGIAGLFPQ